MPHPEAATIRAYTDDGALFAAFLADMGMPTTAGSLRREHAEAFIAAESERTAPASAIGAEFPDPTGQGIVPPSPIRGCPAAILIGDEADLVMSQAAWL